MHVTCVKDVKLENSIGDFALVLAAKVLHIHKIHVGVIRFGTCGNTCYCRDYQCLHLSNHVNLHNLLPVPCVHCLRNQ